MIHRVVNAFDDFTKMKTSCPNPFTLLYERVMHILLAPSLQVIWYIKIKRILTSLEKT
jgi:hypothetical protein